MNMRLEKIYIENFKGIKQLAINFFEKTTISGQNATGKTTIMDCFTWLLFNKDSEGKSDFDIRPNDRQGKPVDNVVIKVSAILETDGKEIVLTKTQEQNWVKKRGSEVSQLQGNLNKYEINEIPKTEKDYKAYIEELMGEELFKLMTSPQVFTSLKWKDQRTILLKLVSEITDQDVVATNEKFQIISQALQEFSVDDLTAKSKKALKELNKRQAELPARIDEASKGLIQADFNECEARKAGIEQQIHDIEEQEAGAAKAGEAIAQINNTIMQKQFNLNELKRKSNEQLIKRKCEIQKRIDDSRYAFSDLVINCEKTEREIRQKEVQAESNRTYREVLLKKYNELQSVQMDKNSLCCPYCKQDLPSDQKEARLEEFQASRKKNLDSIVRDGKQVAAGLEILEKEVNVLKKSVEDYKAQKVKQNRLETAAIEELNVLPKEVDMSDDQEYQFLLEDIRKMENQVREMGTGSGYMNQLRQRKKVLSADLDKIKSILMGKEGNERIQTRVSELQKEQRVTSQLIADQEKGLFLLEEFTKSKMDLLSTRIDAKFRLVNFRLFDTQINGGYKETCECMVNGVPFSSLNAGHRVVAGLDIITALQGIYDITAPIFVDNAESINDFNIPDMEGQLILLKVSEDNELKVEV